MRVQFSIFLYLISFAITFVGPAHADCGAVLDRFKEVSSESEKIFLDLCKKKCNPTFKDWPWFEKKAMREVNKMFGGKVPEQFPGLFKELKGNLAKDKLTKSESFCKKSTREQALKISKDTIMPKIPMLMGLMSECEKILKYLDDPKTFSSWRKMANEYAVYDKCLK
ncbi:hypothetical protein N7462_006161 [Penicillium macrosclerotiorum]|uniref:uncharacterized protein n=1 Tax=Penicillium macrosclerotiorum TaxID=303699 RepID=UPI002546590B|nr:uncharacterized protein N7462_006161 [Penicillium macrosclerotiorum]KAJ5682996.1 hypothetical protein N7462_006161 [Penicillium macrosclerotiorum]